MRIQISYNKVLNNIGLIVFSCYIIFWLGTSLSAVSHDFSNSYFGAYFFLKGQFDLLIFDPFTFNQKINNEGFRNIFANYNPNPPFTALFFIPFTLLPLTFSKFIFNLISSLLFIFSVHRLTKFLNIDAGILFLLIPVVFLVPIRNEILFGQTYFLLFFLLAEGFLAIEKGNKIIGALLWALAVLLKVFPVIVFLFLLLKKDWKSLLALSVMCLLMLSTAILIQGFEVWHYYFTQVLPRNGRGEISSAYMINYQSAHMFFKYAFLQNNDLNPEPLVNSSFLFQASQMCFKSLVLSLCAMAVYKQKGLTEFGLLLLVAILLSPYGSTYENILLAFILFASYKSFRRKVFWLITVLIFFISNLPLSIFNALPEVLQFPRLLLYIILLLVVCYVLKIKLEWRFFAFFLIIFSLSFLLHREIETDNSVLLFKEHKHALIYDYGVKNDHIFYRYWHENGENIQKTEMSVSNLSFNNLELRQNQIFLQGKQITNSRDNKIKPALLDGKAIIYLSDKDKGIGFYSIRLIRLDDVL